jgi:hypothetical protein
VALIFHIESGSYDGMTLDGLNVALAVHTPGPMGEGNWSVAAYIDQRASDKQTEALGAIFTGVAGGPMAQLAPLIAKNLAVSKVPITYRIEDKKHSAEIIGILHMSVDPLPTAHPGGEMWANTGHPVSPDKLALAVGAPGNTLNDHGMRWEADCGAKRAGEAARAFARATTQRGYAIANGRNSAGSGRLLRTDT